MGEVLSLEEAMRRRAAARSLQQKFVFTNGCFDVLHPGHIALFREARRQGHYLLVGLNSDRSVRLLKGVGRPIQTEDARAAVLSALTDVDGIVIFDEDTPRELIQILKPDVLVKGGDYEKELVIGREIVEAAGGRVLIVPLVSGHSTSRLAARLADAE